LYISGFSFMDTRAGHFTGILLFMHLCNVE